jgi:hypothetical protein
MEVMCVIVLLAPLGGINIRAVLEYLESKCSYHKLGIFLKYFLVLMSKLQDMSRKKQFE